MTYNASVHLTQGGDELVVADGGSITVEAGGQIILADGAILAPAGGQAAAIGDVTGGETVDEEGRTAINAILAALRGAGIVAAT